MFKRFHEKKADQTNKTLPTATYQQIHKQKIAIQHTYAQRHRHNRQILKDEQPPQLELHQTDQFIYQGFVKDSLKQGEGVMMLKNGTMIIGNWEQDWLQGRALLFTPLGSRVVAQFHAGKLNGWAISLFDEHIIKCLLYYQNRLDSERLTYEESERMWVASKCAQDGKLLSIAHMEKGERLKLPSFIESEELVDLLKQCLLVKHKYLSLEYVQQIGINDNTNYIGFIDEQKRPCGLGAIYSDRQVYCGNFFEGALEHIGRIFFANGQVYQGGMIGGVFWQRGLYYSPYKNTTTVLMTNEYEQQIQDQLEGYVLISFPISIGATSTNNCSGMKGQAVRALIQDMEAYYVLQFVGSEKHKEIEHEQSHSQYGKSEDLNSKQSPSLWPAVSLNNPPQKWLRFGEDEIPKMQLLQRSRSLDKREVQMRKKSAAEARVNMGPPSNEYQSIQIRQNLDYKQAQGFQRQAPANTMLMPEIPFGKKEGNQFSSLDLGKLNIKSIALQSMGVPNQKPVQILNNMRQLQNSRQSSEISLSEQKLKVLVERGRSHRKKIFY